MRASLRQSRTIGQPIFTPACVHAQETLEQAVPRILHFLVEHIRTTLIHAERNKKNLAGSVHEIRRSLKRARAVARLLKKSLSKEDFKNVDGSLRELKDLYARSRDDQVIRETARKIAEGLERREEKNAAFRWEKKLATSPQKSGQDFDAVAKHAHALLHAVAATPIKIEKGARDLLREELKKSYKRARKTAHKVEAKSSSKALHSLRKHSKILQYQLEIFRDVLPQDFLEYLRDIKKLNRSLGKEHDLFMLNERVKRSPFEKKSTTSSLRSRVETLRTQRRERLIEITKVAFSRRPRQFAYQVALQLPRAKPSVSDRRGRVKL